MWGFAVGMYLNDLSRDNLTLVASYGFSLGVSVVLLGAVIGDIVDRYPRLTGEHKFNFNNSLSNISFCCDNSGFASSNC